MPYLTVNDVELYYEVHGKGEPLLLVAGLASDSQSWLPVIDVLASHYQLIIFDNRGAGRSRPQDSGTSIGQMADDCIALIRHLGLSPVTILGHSMGGFVALDCAVRYPEHVSRLILAATVARNSQRNNALFQDWVGYLDEGMAPERWFRNLFYWIFTKTFFEDKAVLDNAIRLSIDYPYPQTRQAFSNQVEAIEAFNHSDDLQAVKAPTLVICGREDLLFPPAETKESLSGIPHAQFHTVEHAAHSIHMENPGDFIAVVRQFLENQDIA